MQLPTRAEMLRIKGLRVVTRTATRDVGDYTALAQPAARPGRTRMGKPVHSGHTVSTPYMYAAWVAAARRVLGVARGRPWRLDRDWPVAAPRPG